MCPNKEFFLVRISPYLGSKYPYSVQIRENTDQKKFRYLDTIYAVLLIPSEFKSTPAWKGESNLT